MQTRNNLERYVADFAPKAIIGRALAEYVAEQITGQCMRDYVSIVEEACDEIPGLQAVSNQPWDMSQEFTGPFDDMAFCCETCGWWCSTDELNNDGSEALCDDCTDDE